MGGNFLGGSLYPSAYYGTGWDIPVVGGVQSGGVGSPYNIYGGGAQWGGSPLHGGN